MVGDVQVLFVQAFDYARRLVRHLDAANDVVGERAQHRDAVIADQVGAIAVAAERQPGENAGDLADLAGAGDLRGAGVDDVDHRAPVGSAAGHVGDGPVGAERDVADGQTDLNRVDDAPPVRGDDDEPPAGRAVGGDVQAAPGWVGRSIASTWPVAVSKTATSASPAPFRLA